MYKILVDYARRSAADFFFQFFIYRNLEVASLLIAVAVAWITEFNPTIVICVVAGIQLLASLMVSDSYLKIVPYIRVLYLNKYVVSLYLLLNTFTPFFIYLILLAVTKPGQQPSENFLLMTVLLFNNTLFANFLHVYSFSMKEVFLYLPLMIILYLVVIFQVKFFIIFIITIFTVIFFIYKLRNY